MSARPDALAAGPQPRVAFAALRHGPFRLFFVTGMLSMMADSIEHVISYWVIWQAFHSPFLAGFAVISHWAPFLLFGVYIGALADRYDCRRIIQASQMVYILVSLAWALLFLTGRLEMWHASFLLVLHGLAGALWAPATQLIIHDIVGREHLQSAVRLNSTARQLGILAGPLVGGGLLLLLGPSYGLMVNALLYLPLTVWLMRTPYTGHRREGATQVQSGPRLGLGDAWRVLREVSGNRTIVAMVVLAGLSSLLIGNAFQPNMPQFAERLGMAGSGLAYSMLLTANAAGAVGGAVVLEGLRLGRPQARTAIIFGCCWCLAIGAFALATSYVLALAMLFLAGVFNLAFSAMAQTLVQLEAPPEKRGRVIGLFNMSQQGLRVGSGFSVGMLGGVIGVSWSLGLSAAVLLACTLALLAFVAFQQRARAVAA